jgi:hypothetical protein
VTRDASENKTKARVNSASSLISSLLGWMPRNASGPWVSNSPATTKVIGAVTSNRSSLADSVLQPKSAPHNGQVENAHNLTRRAGRLLSEGGDEDRLDGVEAVLGLVKHDAGT